MIHAAELIVDMPSERPDVCRSLSVSLLPLQCIYNRDSNFSDPLKGPEKVFQRFGPESGTKN